MEISDALRQAIDRATVDLDGRHLPLTFVDAAVVPPVTGIHMEVTVEANPPGQPPQRATVGVGFDRLEDVDYMVDALRHTMTRVLSGELKPGYSGVVVSESTGDGKPPVQLKPCPICQQPAKQQWFVNHDATHVMDCDRCGSPIVYREARIELQNAHNGRGPFVSRLVDISRATQAGAISELVDARQVFAELAAFLDEER